MPAAQQSASPASPAAEQPPADASRPEPPWCPAPPERPANVGVHQSITHCSCFPAAVSLKGHRASHALVSQREFTCLHHTGEVTQVLAACRLSRAAGSPVLGLQQPKLEAQPQPFVKDLAAAGCRSCAWLPLPQCWRPACHSLDAASLASLVVCMPLLLRAGLCHCAIVSLTESDSPPAAARGLAVPLFPALMRWHVRSAQPALPPATLGGPCLPWLPRRQPVHGAVGDFWEGGEVGVRTGHRQAAQTACSLPHRADLAA